MKKGAAGRLLRFRLAEEIIRRRPWPGASPDCAGTPAHCRRSPNARLPADADAPVAAAAAGARRAAVAPAWHRPVRYAAAGPGSGRHHSAAAADALPGAARDAAHAAGVAAAPAVRDAPVARA